MEVKSYHFHSFLLFFSPIFSFFLNHFHARVLLCCQNLFREGFVFNMPAIHLGWPHWESLKWTNGWLGAIFWLSCIITIHWLFSASLSFLKYFFPPWSLSQFPPAEILPLVSFLSNYLEPDTLFCKLVAETNLRLQMPAQTGCIFWWRRERWGAREPMK